MNNRQFEKIIGYNFKNEEYLERALTHSSYNRDKNTKHMDNERLEFLGDAFLDAIVSVELFHRMENVTEGRLTKTRALIVCENALAEAARKIDLGSFINMGHGEAQEEEARIQYLPTEWRLSSEHFFLTGDTIQPKSLC